MGALIILHGLFLLHCNGTKKVIGSGDVTLAPQTCEILTADSTDHMYKVGSYYNGQLYAVNLPVSKNLNLTKDLPKSVGKDPDTDNLDSRMIVLESSVVKVQDSSAPIRIIVPMPDDIYGANVVSVFREDVLTTTDSTALRSGSDSRTQIKIAESIVLRYSSGPPQSGTFSLYDNTTLVSGATSAPIKKYQVLALFAWPVGSVMNCAQAMQHTSLNGLLSVNGKATAFQLMGLTAHDELDDPDASALSLPDSILRPPCVKDTLGKQGAIDNRSGIAFQSRTATQTGCGPMVDIEY